MNEERYRVHFALASDQVYKAPARERLSTLYFDIQQPMSSIRGVSSFICYSIERARKDQEMLEEVQVFCHDLKGLSDTLQHLHEEIRNRENSEEAAQSALSTYWNHRHLADQVLELAEQLKNLRVSLEGIVSGLDFLIASLSNAANHLWADLDIFANPGELQIPQEVQDAVKLYVNIGEAKSRSAEQLGLLLKGAASPFSEVRALAGVLCRHYPEDKVVETMYMLLNDPSDKVVRETADSIQYVRSRKLIPVLIQNLDRVFADPSDVGCIGEALAYLPDKQSLEPLSRVLDRLMTNSSFESSTYAVMGIRKAIRAIGGPEAAGVLNRYFNEEA